MISRIIGTFHDVQDVMPFLLHFTEYIYSYSVS
jgi:hypothetical protein